jgi:hypothetical protein
MHQKFLSVHGDCGGVLLTQNRLQIRQCILTCIENKLKESNVFGENTKSIFSYMENKAIRHKIEPISANFRPKAKKFRTLNYLSGHDQLGKKTLLFL